MVAGQRPVQTGLMGHFRAAPVSADVSLAGRRVLVVENNYWAAADVEDWLRAAGADVVGPMASVADALEAVGAGDDLDAAVLDVRLRQDEVVYPLAHRLVDLGVPFLFATAADDIVDHPAFLARPRLWKPLARHHLLQAVHQLLGSEETQVCP